MPKRSRRTSKSSETQYTQSIQQTSYPTTFVSSNPTNKVSTKKSVRIIPRNLAQEEYLELLNDVEKRIIFAVGPAGTGKSLLAMMAGIRALADKKIKKIVLTRPAVGVDDEQHGFLPGDLNQKMEPWVRPLLDVLQEYYTTKEIEYMMEERIIEICPLAFVRGRTFKNAIIILDEAQNCSISQVKSLLTRIGEDSRIFVTGDLNQSDTKIVGSSGFKDILTRLEAKGSKHIVTIQFAHSDIVRDPVVREVLALYGEE